VDYCRYCTVHSIDVARTSAVFRPVATFSQSCTRLQR
jgi:hypothetical protein